MGYIIHHIRSLRRNATAQEKKLWMELRNHQLSGFGCRRQRLIGLVITPDSTSYFVADFCCIKCKLVIEIDGEIHENQKEYDTARQQIIENLGYKVIRFKNEEIDKNLKSVLESIRNIAIERDQELSNKK